MRNLVISAILIALVVAAPAMAQNTTWKHVGGAPYTGSDSTAIWTAPNIPSSVKAHLWDQWAAGSKKKIMIPRGSVLAAVNNRGGWTLRNVQCAWETPERFPSLPAYEVSWQEGAVLYRVGKFSRDLNQRNCGNWYVIVSYQRPQATHAQPVAPRTVTPTYVINNYGGIVVTGNGNTVTINLEAPAQPSQQVRNEGAALVYTATSFSGLYVGLGVTGVTLGEGIDVGGGGFWLRWATTRCWAEVGVGGSEVHNDSTIARDEFINFTLAWRLRENSPFTLQLGAGVGYETDPGDNNAWLQIAGLDAGLGFDPRIYKSVYLTTSVKATIAETRPTPHDLRVGVKGQFGITIKL